MATVDERSRLFGRLNLIDGLLVAFLLGGIPLAYGAYALFRTPAPTLTSITPTALPYGANVLVAIHGQNLRPYMRVSFNQFQGTNFLFGSPSMAEIMPPALSPGVYDVILYDYAQERARLPKALTIKPPPLPSTAVVVVGRLTNLSTEMAGKIGKGFKLPQYSPVIDAGRPHPATTVVTVADAAVTIPIPGALEVPIAFRIGCYVQMIEAKPVCMAAGAGVVLKPDAFLALQTELGEIPFQVDQVRSPDPLQIVEAEVRLTGHPVVLERIRAGDMDLGVATNELAAGASVVRVAPIRRLPESAGPDLASVDVSLRLNAQRDAAGFWYAGDGLRAGGEFRLRTRDYDVKGSVLRLAPRETTAKD